MKERSRAELFESIRRGHRDGFSIRELADLHCVRRRTVRQAIAEAVPPPRKTPARVRPASDPWEPVIRAWMEADRLVHRKQRHKAQRVWERRVVEDGLQAGRHNRTCRGDEVEWRCDDLRARKQLTPLQR